MGRHHPGDGGFCDRAPADVSEVRDLVLFLRACRAENWEGLNMLGGAWERV